MHLVKMPTAGGIFSLLCQWSEAVRHMQQIPTLPLKKLMTVVRLPMAILPLHLGSSPSIALCYGFQVMRSCESPRIPFQIFTSRFQTPPRNIIYDNACKLHIYCLNREPALYKETRFYVDRFHWRGRIGCSQGYCLDMYHSMDITALNSQVNEQANAGLQRIRGQLAYMTPSNFILTLCLFLIRTKLES